MVLHPDGALTSLVQVRGSIPLFWSSPADLSYTPRVRMHGTMLQVSQRNFFLFRGSRGEAGLWDKGEGVGFRLHVLPSGVRRSRKKSSLTTACLLRVAEWRVDGAAHP